MPHLQTARHQRCIYLFLADRTPSHTECKPYNTFIIGMILPTTTVLEIPKRFNYLIRAAN